MVGGAADEGFGPVADAFRANFAERGELGAACAVYRDGHKVVDLWGGHRDAGRGRRGSRTRSSRCSRPPRAWRRWRSPSRTAAGCSTTTRSWRATGPSSRRRQGARHGAAAARAPGRPGAIDERARARRPARPRRVATALAAQRPAWEPGTRHGYHGITLGWYEGELIRRVDPQRRTLGRFFAEEVADPLGLEFYIGLPDDVPPERVARIDGYNAAADAAAPEAMPRFVLGFLNPRSRHLPHVRQPDASPGCSTSTTCRELQRAETPGGQRDRQGPRSVARAYGEFATGGAALGLDAGHARRPAAPGGRPERRSHRRGAPHRVGVLARLPQAVPALHVRLRRPSARSARRAPAARSGSPTPTRRSASPTP